MKKLTALKYSYLPCINSTMQSECHHGIAASVCKASIHILFHHFRQQDMKKQRISLAIGIVASIIFLLCVALVTISLHLTPQMDQFASKSQDNVLLLYKFQFPWLFTHFHVVDRHKACPGGLVSS